MGTLYIEAECKTEKEKRHGIHWKLHHMQAPPILRKTKGPALPLYLLPIPWRGGGGNTGHGTIYKIRIEAESSGFHELSERIFLKVGQIDLVEALHSSL